MNPAFSYLTPTANIDYPWSRPVFFFAPAYRPSFPAGQRPGPLPIPCPLPCRQKLKSCSTRLEPLCSDTTTGGTRSPGPDLTAKALHHDDAPAIAKKPMPPISWCFHQLNEPHSFVCPPTRRPAIPAMTTSPTDPTFPLVGEIKGEWLQDSIGLLHYSLGQHHGFPCRNASPTPPIVIARPRTRTGISGDHRSEEELRAATSADAHVSAPCWDMLCTAYFVPHLRPKGSAIATVTALRLKAGMSLPASAQAITLQSTIRR